MSKTKPRRDDEREERIENEIVVDCCDQYERAMGWHCYLTDQLQFPFTAICVAKRSTSPLRVKDEVEVIGIADQDECEREMLVTMPWEKDGLAVPLAQLKPIEETDEETRQAVEDWLYWVNMGYEF